jgi:hypothetical protein
MTRPRKKRPDLSLVIESRPFCDGGFAIPATATYVRLKPSKPIELPPEAANAFVRDLRAFFAEKGHKRSRPSAVRAQAALQREAAPHRREGDVRADEVNERKKPATGALFYPMT